MSGTEATVISSLIDDVRYAMRSLLRTPGHTAFVIVTLALGIGMTTTPLSMLDALIFRPYPVPQSGDIVSLVSTSRDSAFDRFSYREYLDIRRHTKSYDGVIATGNIRAVGFSPEPGVTPLVRAGMLVSGNFFSVLGVVPQLGRGFRVDEDEAPGRDAVTVLGPDFWRREFASDPSVIGRTIRLNGASFTVIGVAPDTFQGLLIFTRPDFYVPTAMAEVFAANAKKNFFEDRDDRELTLRARVKDGTTIDEAQSELAALAGTFAREYPELNRDRGAAVKTLFQMRTQEDDINWKFAVVFTGLAVAVLLVACTNVAALLLARARTRTREIAVRLALGAGRGRLIRLLMTESLILSSLGGLGGILVGALGIRFFQTFSIPAELPVTIPFRMDTRLLVASVALSVMSALACGLAPALQSSRGNLVNGLKTADVDMPGRRLWGRNALVVAQVAMSLMLLTAAFLMFRGFEQSSQQATGFAKDNLLLIRFDPRLVQYDADRIDRFYKVLTQRVRAMPGVRGAGLMQNPPLGLGAFGSLAFVPDGYDMPRDRQHFTSMTDTIDEGFFDTLQIPIMRGRAFSASDTAATPRVAVVNEHFANRYWPGQDAVGKIIRLDHRGGAPVEIVGVAKTVKYRETTEKPTDFIYLPLSQRPTPRMVLMLRSGPPFTDPQQLLGPVKDVVRGLDANLPLLEARTFDDLYRYHVVEGPRMAIQLVTALGIVGFVLAIAGLYGLVAYNVSRRTREIGIRLAIGAEPSDVLRLMMGKGLLLAGIGTVIGLAMGVGVERVLNAALFNAGGVDILAYAVVVPSMLVVTMIAAYVPARRAAAVAPTQALRME